jgi:autoinducer 2-degrading protein
MLIRIVKMSFHPEKVEAFLSHFEGVKSKIRSTPGNHFLALYQDKDNKSQFFTYSFWDNEAALDAYRNSAFFGEVWTYTKTLFNAKPEAWSVTEIEKLP